MIVHHLGQRQQRRRHQCDQKPEQTETDHARLSKNGSPDSDGDEKDAERQASPEARIISCCKRVEIVIGRESNRPKEGLKVVKDHIWLSDHVIAGVRCAGDPRVRGHVLYEKQHRAADQERRDDLREISECAAPGVRRLIVLSGKSKR